MQSQAHAGWSHQVISPLVKDGAHTPGRATPINDHTTYTHSLPARHYLLLYILLLYNSKIKADKHTRVGARTSSRA